MDDEGLQNKDALLVDAIREDVRCVDKESTLLAPFDVGLATSWLDRFVALVHYHRS